MDIFLICVWLALGAKAWWDSIREFGFKTSDLIMLPVGMALGPIALAANWWDSK